MATIDDKLDKINDKITDISVTLASQQVTLENQHESLKEHMRRSDALEEQMKPLKKHVTIVEGIIKFIGILALLGGLIETIVHLLK